MSEFDTVRSPYPQAGSNEGDRTGDHRPHRAESTRSMSESSTPASVEKAQDTNPNLDPRVARALAVNDLVAQHPVAESAHIRPFPNGHASVNVRWVTTSHKTHSKKYYNQTFVVDEKGKRIYESHLQAVSEEVKVTTTSAFGEWTINFRETEVNEKKKRIVEIIHEDSGVYGELDVTKLHGSFLDGSQWGQPAWLSEKECILVYVAEQHPPHFDEDDKPYTAYEYAQSFGEQFTSQTRPGLFLLDFSSRDDVQSYLVSPSEDVDPTTSTMFRQPALVARDSKEEPLEVYATGSSCLPNGRRLGSIWCTNRPDAIYRITIDTSKKAVKSTERISDPSRSAREPRVIKTPGGMLLTYISNRRGYEHNSCATFHRRRLPNGLKGGSIRPQGQDDIFVDTVGAPSREGGFPGLYPAFPGGNCLLSTERLTSENTLNTEKLSGEKTSDLMVFQSNWGSRAALVTLGLRSGKVVQSDQGDAITSYTPLATDGHNRVVAISSSLVGRPQLLVGLLSIERGDPIFQWSDLKTWSYRFEAGRHFAGVDTLYAAIIPLPGWKATEAVVISTTPFPADSRISHYKSRIPGIEAGTSKTNTGPSPLIIDPHGGPNGHSTAAWNSGKSLALLAAGFTVAFVNYPGSIGFGQNSIEALTKDCGNLDVKACVEVKNHLVKLGIASNEKGKRLYIGGSHSGFIGAHLAARYYDDFDAIDIRNPVIDLPSNFATTDIPDWAMAQFDIGYDFNNPPSFVPNDLFKKLKEASPSFYMEKLFAQRKGPCMPPMQLQLGDSDLRVPPSQGRAWYHALKGHGEDVKLLMYPGNGHPLEKVWADPVVLHATVEFLAKHANFD